MRQLAQNAARNVKFHSSQTEQGLFFARNAIETESQLAIDFNRY